MQRRVAVPPAAVHAGATHLAPLAPTSLDRLLDRLERGSPQLVRASELLLVLVTAALAVVDVAVWATDPSVDPGRLPMSIAIAVPCLGVLAALAVALRRRHLVPALFTLAGTSVVLTVAGYAIGTGLPPSFGALLALALLTVGVLRRAPGGTAIALATLAALAVAAEALRPRVSTVAYLLVVCEAAFGVAVAVGVYLRWSDWRRVVAEASARTDERLALARELHDLVGHFVTGIVVQAQAARHVAERRPAAAVAALERIETAGTAAMTAMRHVVGGLRQDAPVTPGWSWDDVDELIAGVIGQGEPVHATIDPEAPTIAPELAPSVHRILAESLTNVRRHARGVTRVDVAVRRVADRLVVTVLDDGRVVGPPGHHTYGIVGMRERVTSLGGSLLAGPAPGGGWRVQAELPLEHRA